MFREPYMDEATHFAKSLSESYDNALEELEYLKSDYNSKEQECDDLLSDMAELITMLLSGQTNRSRVSEILYERFDSYEQKNIEVEAQKLIALAEEGE